MEISINDKIYECGEGTTLLSVLNENDVCTDNVAIAINYDVIPRADWANTKITDGAKIIIIKASQGG